MTARQDPLRITLIRCSTVLLEWRAQRWLTDPWFGMHLRGLPVFRRPASTPERLGPLDALLVSHLHPDHFEPGAVARLRPRPPRIIAPPGASAARALAPFLDVLHELTPWRSLALGDGATLWAVPGPHTGPGPAEVNYVLDLPDFGHAFFGGDARFHGPTLAAVGARFGPFRLALLPVGGTRILGRRTVMGPADAWRAARLLEAEVVIPLHEGGLWLSVPPFSLHPGRTAHLATIAARAGAPDRVVVLAEGETASCGGAGAPGADGARGTGRPHGVIASAVRMPP
jgi:L-ascorbate metabolism protein UlaG (beta-lactamase superfamily)